MSEEIRILERRERKRRERKEKGNF